jgi:hypothetical protein
VNKLDYSISLRAKGLSKEAIIKEMGANGFNESEIKFYLKKSDDIHLKQLLNNKRSKSQTKFSRVFKTVILIISLLLLLVVFYGHATIGLIGLFLFWSLVKFSSYRK